MSKKPSCGKTDSCPVFKTTTKRNNRKDPKTTKIKLPEVVGGTHMNVRDLGQEPGTLNYGSGASSNAAGGVGEQTGKYLEKKNTKQRIGLRMKLGMK